MSLTAVMSLLANFFFSSIVDFRGKLSHARETVQFEQQTEAGSTIPQIHIMHLSEIAAMEVIF